MTAKEFNFMITPRWSDLDANQHARHSAYADWATHSRMAWLDQHGFTFSKLRELRTAPILFEDTTRYLKEVALGEEISIDLQLVGLNHDASRYHLRQTFRRGETVCAEYEIKGAWLDVASRRIAPPPAGLAEALTRNIPRAPDFAEIGPARKFA
jgi:acyl-CoA thioester hydrolase